MELTLAKLKNLVTIREYNFGKILQPFSYVMPLETMSGGRKGELKVRAKSQIHDVGKQ